MESDQNFYISWISMIYWIIFRLLKYKNRSQKKSYTDSYSRNSTYSLAWSVASISKYFHRNKLEIKDAVKHLRMHRIVQNIKIGLINRRKDMFVTLLDVTNGIQIQGKLWFSVAPCTNQNRFPRPRAPPTLYRLKIPSSSLRKHKKTVHGPDSHVSGGKKPRPNPSRDNKKDPNDNFAKRGLKATNIKSSKPITG